MNKRIKILCALITLILCVSVFTFTATATAEPAPTTAPAPVETAPPAPVEPTPTTAPESGGTLEPDPGYDDPGYTEETIAPDQGFVEEPTTGGYVDSYTNEDGYYYYDEDEMVNNIEGTAGNVSDYTSLYDTSDFDESALKESKWDNIALDISSAQSDNMDFSAIKENDSTEDDGEWMLYTGLVLLALSLIGILYFIIATATYKKKLKKLKAREQRQRHRDSDRPRDDYGDLSEFPTQLDYNRRYQRNRYAGAGAGYAERKRRNADTAEIDVPRRYSAKH